MRHVQLAKQESPRFDIERRLTGRFYTPYFIAEKLAEQAIGLCASPESVADPFCGDGRLIVAWLRRAAKSGGALNRLRRIVVWDYDPTAVREAKQAIDSELGTLGLSASVLVDAESGDTFDRVQRFVGTVDTVLTNPPWDLLKPDTRDGLVDESGFKTQIKEYSSVLAARYPDAVSMRGKAVSGYGVNLARAGAIAAGMLTRADGVVAIVLPATIFADQASSPFRSWLFSRLAVRSIDYFPAESRLFEGVDQAFVMVSARAGGSTDTLSLTRFNNHVEVLERRNTHIRHDRSAAIPLAIAGDQQRLVDKLKNNHAPLGLLEGDLRFGLWLGRELDETRLHESLTSDAGGIPFLKGRHVFPYSVVCSEALRIDSTKRVIPGTIREQRLAWRDVSRPNQRRRMHVSLVPEGFVTGNSLGVAYFRYAPNSCLKVLLAVMNSLTFELQVRSRLATAHVSQGILRQCAIPLPCFEDETVRNQLARRVAQHLLSRKCEAPDIEVTIAQLYGLSRDDFAVLLEGFPKFTTTERAEHLKPDLWE